MYFSFLCVHTFFLREWHDGIRGKTTEFPRVYSSPQCTYLNTETKPKLLYTFSRKIFKTKQYYWIEEIKGREYLTPYIAKCVDIPAYSHKGWKVVHTVLKDRVSQKLFFFQNHSSSSTNTFKILFKKSDKFFSFMLFLNHWYKKRQM